MGGTSIPEESWKEIINSIDKNGDGEVITYLFLYDVTTKQINYLFHIDILCRVCISFNPKNGTVKNLKKLN